MDFEQNPSARPGITSATSHKALFKRRILQVVGEVKKQNADVERNTKLQERLEEQQIFEILKNGGRGYKNLSVRKLYAYVVKAITVVPAKYSKSDRLRKTVAANAKVNMRRTSMVGVIPERILKQGMKLDNDSGRGLGPVLEEGSMSKDSDEDDEEQEEVTIRDRLGNFLHPRDIRKLFIPFSATSEPEIIVRRHVVLLNFDTLRAIVLRDRLLVFVPQGEDGILEELEKKIRQGVAAAETERQKEPEEAAPASFGDLVSKLAKKQKNPVTDYFENEWSEMKLGESGEGWIDLAFELRCLDSFMETVASSLYQDANELMSEAERDMENLISTRSLNGSLVRQDKDKLTEMTSRVQGFSRAINLLLDNNEDLALMNLSRLISHPERFIQPVSLQILNEEADEPELILEAHLQETNTLLNELGLTSSSITSTQEELNQRRDTVRNRLLYAEMILSIISLAVALGSLIGSYMGMNVTNHIETDPDAFVQICVWTSVGAILLVLLLMFGMSRSGVLPRIEEL